MQQFIVLFSALLGVIPDGILTAYTFSDLLKANNNLFTQFLAIVGGFIVTAFVALHKQLEVTKSPLLFTLFVIAISIDIYTTYYGITNEVQGNKILAVGLVVIINGLTLSFSRALEELG